MILRNISVIINFVDFSIVHGVSLLLLIPANDPATPENPSSIEFYFNFNIIRIIMRKAVIEHNKYILLEIFA